MINPNGIAVNVQGNFVTLSPYVSGRSPPIRQNSDISGFSISSSRRLKRYCRAAKSKYRTMLTLTYPAEWKPHPKVAKRNLRAFFERVRRSRFWKDAESSMLWIMEFTAAGTIHFHGWYTGYIDKGWLSHNWNAIACPGNGAHLKAGTRIEAFRAPKSHLIRYVLKYAAKREQKNLPQGVDSAGRWWGVVGVRDVLAAGIAASLRHHNGPKVWAEVDRLKKLMDLWVSQGRARYIRTEWADIWWVESERDAELAYQLVVGVVARIELWIPEAQRIRYGDNWFGARGRGEDREFEAG